MIDALLKVNLPQGPCWYRYNGDGYGEHEDGSPFDGTGIGRAWPLLAGERAHYELAAGRPQGCRGVAPRHRAFHRRRAPDSRAGLGHDGYCRPRTVSWETDRFRVSTGVGPLRVRQTAAVVAGRKNLRTSHPRPCSATRWRSRKLHTSSGVSTTSAEPFPRGKTCAWCCPHRPWSTGASMAGKPRRTQTRAIRSVCLSQTCPATSSR